MVWCDEKGRGSEGRETVKWLSQVFRIAGEAVSGKTRLHDIGWVFGLGLRSGCI